MILPRGAIARLPFDGSLADVIGNNDATLLAGTPLYDEHGFINLCFLSSEAEYASMPFPPTGDWTVMFFARPISSQIEVSSTFFLLSDGVNSYGLGVYSPPGYGLDTYGLGSYGGWESLAIFNTNDNPVITDLAIALIDPNWQFFALRQSGGVVDVFINGYDSGLNITNHPTLTNPVAYLFGNPTNGGLVTRTDDLILCDVALTDEEIRDWLLWFRPLKLSFYRRPVAVQFVKKEQQEPKKTTAEAMKKARSVTSLASLLPSWEPNRIQYQVVTSFSKANRHTTAINLTVPAYIEMVAYQHEALVKRMMVERSTTIHQNMKAMTFVPSEDPHKINMALPKYKEAMGTVATISKVSLIQNLTHSTTASVASFIVEEGQSAPSAMIYQTNAAISYLGQVQRAKEEVARLANVAIQTMVDQPTTNKKATTQRMGGSPLLNRKGLSNQYGEKKYQLPKPVGTPFVEDGKGESRPKTFTKTPVKKLIQNNRKLSKNELAFTKTVPRTAVTAQEKEFIKKQAPSNATVRASFGKYIDKHRKLTRYVTTTNGNIQRIIINCSPWKEQ